MSTAGCFMTAKIGGATPVEIEDNSAWKVQETVKELDRTVGADQGYGNVDAGVYRATITLHGFLDLATVTGGGYEDVSAGFVVSNLKLYYNRGDTTPAYVFPSCLSVDSTLGGEVDGQFEWDATLKNKGIYSRNAPGDGS